MDIAIQKDMGAINMCRINRRDSAEAAGGPARAVLVETVLRR